MNPGFAEKKRLVPQFHGALNNDSTNTGGVQPNILTSSELPSDSPSSPSSPSPFPSSTSSKPPPLLSSSTDPVTSPS